MTPLDTTPPNPFPSDFSAAIPSAPESVPVDAPVMRSPMSELEWAAVWLAFAVLAMVLLIACALLFSAYSGEYSSVTPEIATIQKLLDRAAQHYDAASAPETLERSTQLLHELTETRQAARKVWFDFAQILLLNLLLPVLTAILGYVFGTMKASSRKSDE